MQVFANKTVIILSPQPWGKMFVAKHHYAVELARQGNRVFFVNPPSFGVRPFVHVEKVHEGGEINVVDHGASIPTGLRFHFRKGFDWLMKRHVGRLLRELRMRPDIVWCFEPNLYADLRWFKGALTIYHPVDDLMFPYQISPAAHADVVISVTREILEKFEAFPCKKLFLNHGIGHTFSACARVTPVEDKKRRVVGYSGNLLRADIDHPVLSKCIRDYPGMDFIFWGNHDYAKAGFSLEGKDGVAQFIEFLRSAPNVQLRGLVRPEELAAAYDQIDIFLICYDIEKDQSKGTNYHKVIEFLSTGKVIVSNNITTYRDYDLIRMCRSRENNDELPGLLGDTASRIQTYNGPEAQSERIAFALANTYEKHLATIDDALNELSKKNGKALL